MFSAPGLDRLWFFLNRSTTPRGAGGGVGGCQGGVVDSAPPRHSAHGESEVQSTCPQHHSCRQGLCSGLEGRAMLRKSHVPPMRSHAALGPVGTSWKELLLEAAQKSSGQPSLCVAETRPTAPALSPWLAVFVSSIPTTCVAHPFEAIE